MTSSIFGEDEVVIQLNTTDDGNGCAVDSMEQEHQEAGEEDDDTSPARETRAVSSSVELGRRLLAAARDGDTAAVLDLMAKGAPFTSDWLGTSPLHLAASNNQAEMCAVLLRAGVSRDARTKVDRTPLHLAAYGGHEEAAKTLLEHGAQVDCRDMLGMTPLAWAAERGHAGVARLLLAGGADPRARSKFRLAPRDLAASALLPDMDRACAETPRPRPRPAHEPKTPETKSDKTDTKINGGAAGEAGEAGLPAGCSGRAARMLRRHGITLLPPDTDTGCTLLAAIHSGRTLHLSETGRLMLKESVAEAKAAINQQTPTSNTNVTNLSNVTKVANLTNVANVTNVSNVTKLTNLTNLSTGKTVTTPRPVKMITINKQKQNSNITIKKIISSNDQVRYVALPNNTRLLPVRNASVATSTPTPASAATTQPAPIVTTAPNNLADLSSFNNVTSTEDGVVRVPEQFLKSTDPEYLRARLLQAVAALTKTRKELAKYKSMAS